MSDIAPVSHPAATAPNHSARVTQQPVAAAATLRAADKVELSRSAQLLSKLAELPDVRMDVVNRVKGEIAKGGYESDAKIEAALDRLAEDL